VAWDRRVVIFCWYRPTPALDDKQSPTCTVIVPAYNEGRQVFDTLRSIVHNVLVNCCNLTLGQLLHVSVVGLLLVFPWLVLPKLFLAAAVASCAPG
jgi:hypothetical protein